MDKQEYVCVNEFEADALVGTLDVLEEKIEDRGWSLANCEFFEQGERVIIGLARK